MVVTQTSLNSIRTQVLNSIQTEISHIAIGSDNTAPDVTDTALGSEITRESLVDEDILIDTYSTYIFLDTTEANGNTIREMGAFNQASGGTMFNRALTNEIAKDSTKEVTVQLDITVATVNT